MLTKFPKDDSQMRWTSHVKGKMAYYGLSEGRIRRVIKNPKRREEGIALNTVAVMDRHDTPTRKEEIWVMFQESNKTQKKENKKAITHESKMGQLMDERLEALRLSLSKPKMTIISAWRYPGVSKPGKAIPIPDDILAELEEVLQ